MVLVSAESGCGGCGCDGGGGGGAGGGGREGGAPGTSQETGGPSPKDLPKAPSFLPSYPPPPPTIVFSDDYRVSVRNEMDLEL